MGLHNAVKYFTLFATFGDLIIDVSEEKPFFLTNQVKIKYGVSKVSKRILQNNEHFQ